LISIIYVWNIPPRVYLLWVNWQKETFNFVHHAAIHSIIIWYLTNEDNEWPGMSEWDYFPIAFYVENVVYRISIIKCIYLFSTLIYWHKCASIFCIILLIEGRLTALFTHILRIVQIRKQVFCFLWFDVCRHRIYKIRFFFCVVLI